MGQIYKRKWKDKTGRIVEGDVWWIKYYRHGKPYRESTHTDMKTKAEKLLKKREGEIVEGKLPSILFEKVAFNELAEDYLRDYRINGRDTTDKAERSVEYLKTFFDGMKAMDISTDKIGAYVENRMNRGLSNATINRELAALKRMFRLAAKCTPPKVAMIPYIPMLKESNVRKGFFEAHEYQALKDALPDELKPLVTFAYHSGWRKTEILGLTWDRVDLKEGIVRLDPGETKNEEGRTLYLDGELMEEVRKLFANRHLGCSFVFHRNGQPIRDFRGSWDAACIKAGLCEILKDDEGRPVVIKNKKGKGEVVKVPTKIFHDFRRTAIRDMVRSGVSERVAMRISGHKTRAVFDRYNIVSDQDLKEAIAKKQAYHAKQDVTEAVDTNRGEVIQFKQAQNEQSKKF
jgi:integrase